MKHEGGERHQVVKEGFLEEVTFELRQSENLKADPLTQGHHLESSQGQGVTGSADRNTAGQMASASALRDSQEQ